MRYPFSYILMRDLISLCRYPSLHRSILTHFLTKVIDALSHLMQQMQLMLKTILETLIRHFDCIHCSVRYRIVGYLEHMLSMGLSCEPTLSPKFILWILDEVKCFKTHFDTFRKGRSRWVPQINFGFRVEVGINCKSQIFRVKY